MLFILISLNKKGNLSIQGFLTFYLMRKMGLEHIPLSQILYIERLLAYLYHKGVQLRVQLRVQTPMRHRRFQHKQLESPFLFNASPENLSYSHLPFP